MNVQLASDENFPQLLESHAKVVVKYYADWCGSCKLFSPKFKRLSTDERFADVVFVDINAEENEHARKLGGVDNLPYFATFENGQLKEGQATSLENVVVEMISRLN
ncbi:MAG TPA: thioredoxin family protein [Luteibaculaceae bacterium]|nr:thioredoxin family protein [Luteibaculaceae bacterium]